MLLVPRVYQHIYNQGFAIGWAEGCAEVYARNQAKRDPQISQLIADWEQRQAAANQAGLPFAEPPPWTDPGKIPVPPASPAPWQEPELPDWLNRLMLSLIGALFLATAAAILLLT